MSLVTQKHVFGVCDKVRLKPTYAATESSKRLEILDIEKGGTVLYYLGSNDKGTDYKQVFSWSGSHDNDYSYLFFIENLIL